MSQCAAGILGEAAAVFRALEKHSFGAIVEGVDLKERHSAATIKQIKEGLHQHRLLIFRGQGKISGEKQVEISRWFGEVESTFYKHPASPHPEIFRVSNDESEGCTNVGRSGWHIDGSFMAKPFKVQTMHFWSVNGDGNTLFSGMNELIENLGEEKRALWERLYFTTRDNMIHPLIYPHPITSVPTMCFHCGKPFVATFLTGKAFIC